MSVKNEDNLQYLLIKNGYVIIKRFVASSSKFSTWSLRSTAAYIKEKKMVKIAGIGHTTMGDILRKNGIEWRHSKTVLDSSNKSRDPQYELKKRLSKS
jgi:hypothetical protein